MGNCGLRGIGGEGETTEVVMETPYRVSCEAAPRFNGGVWKVKLAITPAQLSEILSQDTRTEALIETVRSAANFRGSASSIASSDHWSVSSSG